MKKSTLRIAIPVHSAHHKKREMSERRPDELLPLTNGSVTNFNGWSVTLIDALDTMWIMGLHDEFQEVIPIIAEKTFALDEGSFAPFFETVIRYLGGLLSAYALSGEPILLARADDLGKMLLPAFNTPHGLPTFAVNTVSGAQSMGWAGRNVLLSEMATCQMEYKYLAHLTGRQSYFDRAEKIMDVMNDAMHSDGILPTQWSLDSGKPINTHFSVGAFADSAHEYLLKQWLMTAKSETKARDMYMRVATAVIKNLLFLSPTRGFLYVTDVHGTQPSNTFEHLSCFLPGLLALGARTLPLAAHDRELHEWAAQGLAYSCWLSYADHASGLGPDEMAMDSGGKRWLDEVEKWRHRADRQASPRAGRDRARPRRHTGLSVAEIGVSSRPETVESFYYLWRTTGDSVYASVSDVEPSPAPKKNMMPSFFLAETLKYLYLLFTDDELIPLDQWVFNTEAHPFPVFQWADWEKKLYRIA
ncbi:Mannosyl-oligosaccharide 1,2-alpha-mannosidase IC [Grifola frondosa]|uniref:alpha-1,2-Mannosidase n=1 Tax=Grifola frondosa TaxID=5627 RepID=A0A1C7LRZ1_GRIFR|nr:Mannosyl-oligosaccharide 1,2-alpha-mannosidase IC [Grifola frondosa]